jgi:RNA polymerase sigma-70 factor (ECF subfamily)
MLVVSEPEQLPVQAARAGNSGAWEALFKRYQLPLYVYVFELVYGEQTALDIVQETFINAARHIGSLQDDRKFGSWLFSIAHQKCIQLWRKNKLEQIPLEERDDAYESAEADPQEVLIHKEQEEQFMKVLGQLAAPHRAVLLLYFVEDFSIEEIARITTTSIGTVKSRMHYARKTLKKLLEQSEL